LGWVPAFQAVVGFSKSSITISWAAMFVVGASALGVAMAFAGSASALGDGISFVVGASALGEFRGVDGRDGVARGEDEQAASVKAMRKRRVKRVFFI
jgi:hypothetical protein